MKKALGAAVLAAGLLVVSAPSFAHHSFAAEFDGSNCKDFTGTLTKLEWTNPHGFFYVDVKDASGKVENWSFQTYALITLRRAGTVRQASFRTESLTHRGSHHEMSQSLLRRVRVSVDACLHADPDGWRAEQPA